MATPNYAIPTIDPNALVKNGPADINAALAAIDSKFSGYVSGTLVGRPPDGIPGRLYRATDTGQVFIDTGTSWVEIATDPAGLLAPYKCIGETQGGFSLSSGTPAGPYYFSVSGSGGGPFLSGSQSQGPQVVSVIPADYAIAGRTTKFRVRSSLIIGNIAPGLDFTFGLYPIASLSGQIVPTLGAAISGSTVTQPSPGANGQYRNNSGDFTIGSNGTYVLGVSLSASPGVSFTACVSMFLDVHHT